MVLVEEKRFLWIPRGYFSGTFQADSTSRGPAAFWWATLRIKKQDCDWIAVTDLVCWLKKHTHSPVRLGEPGTNCRFFYSSGCSASARGPKLMRKGEQTVLQTREKHGLKGTNTGAEQEVMWHPTGSQQAFLKIPQQTARTFFFYKAGYTFSLCVLLEISLQ